MLVGPSNSGKSYFYNTVLKPQLQELNDLMKEPLQVVYLSSDEIRRQILGFDAHKMSKEMMQVSGEAFKILMARLKASSSYPVNAHVIVLDTTGLSEDFRKEVSQVAKENNYNFEAFVFDYKDNQDYLKFITDDEDYSYKQKKVTMDHLKRLRQDVLKSVKREFKELVKFKSLEEVSNYKIPDLKGKAENYNKQILSDNENYTLIGDIHGCLVELKELLVKLGVELKGEKIISIPEKVGKLILIGDLIDKGMESGKVIDFVYNNLSSFLVIRGNHERFVVNEFKKPQDLDIAIKKEYFDSIYTLSQEEVKKLTSIYEVSFDFLKNTHFIASHAPCPKQYLGKKDNSSIKLMQKTRFMKKRKDFDNTESFLAYMEQEFSYLQSEKNKNHAFHIFGHTTFPSFMKWDNKIAIDSGCVYGGSLTAVTVSSKGSLQFVSVKTKEHTPFSDDGIIAPFSKKVHTPTTQYTLSDFDKERINILAENKIQFISGTISPADKDLDKNELESLEKGLNYFKEKHVKKVVLQTKHMGSRCNIYLDKDIDNCRAVSRNGFLIKKLDLTPVFSSLQEKFNSYMQENKIKTMILDGELMPWSSLGKELISEQFKVVGEAVKSEIALLKENGFNEALEALIKHPQKENFDSEVIKVSKAKMQEKYGYQLYNNLLSLRSFDFNLDNQEDSVSKYQKQVDFFGKEKEAFYLPFALLKVIYEDNSEKSFVREDVRTAEIYKLISEQEFLEIDFSEPNYYQKALDFYNKVVSLGEEGIVIKPEFTFHKGMAPFIKVRNREYLRIIYGYDYQNPLIYKDLIESKKVQKKMRVSAIEYEIGKKLLDLKEGEISPDNQVYVDLITQMIAQENEEKKLDIRL